MIIRLFANENGYNDYDITDHPIIKRCCIAFTIKDGDIFNAYTNDGLKFGIEFKKSLENSIKIWEESKDVQNIKI